MSMLWEILSVLLPLLYGKPSILKLQSDYGELLMFENFRKLRNGQQKFHQTKDKYVDTCI